MHFLFAIPIGAPERSIGWCYLEISAQLQTNNTTCLILAKRCGSNGDITSESPLLWPGFDWDIVVLGSVSALGGYATSRSCSCYAIIRITWHNKASNMERITKSASNRGPLRNRVIISRRIHADAPCMQMDLPHAHLAPPRMSAATGP